MLYIFIIMMSYKIGTKYHRNLRHMERIKLIEETPSMFWHEKTQTYINNQITHPKSVWVQEIIQHKREQEYIKLKTDEFIFLPDTKNIYKKCFFSSRNSVHFNWMVVVTDPTLRNIRDLRQHHIPLLERIKQLAVETIQKEYATIQMDDIMIYANYPPSIHTLHFHFCFPFFSASAFDAFRIHSIDHIINNLRINPKYYAISTFIVPLHERSPIAQIYRELKTREDDSTPATLDLLSGKHMCETLYSLPDTGKTDDSLGDSPRSVCEKPITIPVI